MAIPQFRQKQWMSQETPSKKKERREKKTLKKTTLTQMVGEVNLKQTDWKAEIVVHHPRQNSWRINSWAIVQKKNQLPSSDYTYVPMSETTRGCGVTQYIEVSSKSHHHPVGQRKHTVTSHSHLLVIVTMILASAWQLSPSAVIS